MKAVGGAIIWGIIVLLVLAALPKHPETKPREYPLWCHNAKDISKSGVCSKVKGLAWSI